LKTKCDDFCLTTSLQPETLGFFSTSIALPLFDLGVHLEGIGIVMDEKLLNYSYKVYCMIKIPKTHYL